MSVWVVLVPLAFQRRKLFRSVVSKKWRHFVITSFITSELMKLDVHEFGCFFHPKVIADLCGSSVTTLRNFIFVVVLGPPVCMLYLLTMLLLPSIGGNWLFFLVISLVHITVRFVIETLASESGSDISSTIFSWQCHLFITVWAFILWKHGQAVFTCNISMPLIHCYYDSKQKRNKYIWIEL